MHFLYFTHIWVIDNNISYYLGIVIGILHPSNITACLSADGINHREINISNFLLVILIGSSIELPIILCFYFYLVIVFFDMHSIGCFKDIFFRLRIMASVFITALSIFGWIVFCEFFYNCYNPPMLILFTCIAIFGIPQIVVLYNAFKR